MQPLPDPLLTRSSPYPLPLCSSPLPPSPLHRSPPSTQAVANLAWAYSGLRYDHPQLYASLARATLRLLGRRGAAEAGEGAGAGRGAEAGGDGAEAVAGGSPGGSWDEASGGNDIGRSGGSRQGVNAQAVSMIAIGFASANRCDSPAQRQVGEPGSAA